MPRLRAHTPASRMICLLSIRIPEISRTRIDPGGEKVLLQNIKTFIIVRPVLLFQQAVEKISYRSGYLCLLLISTLVVIRTTGLNKCSHFLVFVLIILNINISHQFETEPRVEKYLDRVDMYIILQSPHDDD